MFGSDGGEPGADGGRMTAVKESLHEEGDVINILETTGKELHSTNLLCLLLQVKQISQCLGINHRHQAKSHYSENMGIFPLFRCLRGL